MAILAEIRYRYVDIDARIGPIEEAYQIFSSNNLILAKDELDNVDTLRYDFEKMLKKAVSSILFSI